MKFVSNAHRRAVFWAMNGGASGGGKSNKTKFVKTEDGIVAEPHYVKSEENKNYSSTKPILTEEEHSNKAIEENRNKILNETPKEVHAIIEQLVDDYEKGNDSKAKYMKEGLYTDERKKLHSEIVENAFSDKSSIDKTDPDVYFLGGVGGSGKDSYLKPQIKEKTITIDPDEYKKELAKTDKSPIESKPLIHAQFLHRESGDIEEQIRHRAINEKRNIIENSTMSNKDEIMSLIDKYKNAGYDVHILGAELPITKAIDRATQRFLYGEGRYVPLSVIKAKGNTINRNVIFLTKYSDTHQIFDTNVERGANANLMAKSDAEITDNFRKPTV